MCRLCDHLGVSEIPSVEELRRVGVQAGLDDLGFTTAEPLVEARLAIEERKQAGLHGGMWFTYGRPDRSTDPGRILPGARSIVVGARRYHRRDDPSPEANQARVARYVYRREYEHLARALEAVAGEIRRRGWRAEVVLDDNRLVDRAVAYRAGMGWLAKNTNLISERLGSWLVLGSVVTDCPLDTEAELRPDGCGPCNRCRTACPTGALDTAGVLDARRCLAWLVQAGGTFPVQFREALGDRLYGCDICQDVCPVNTRTMSPDERAETGVGGGGRRAVTGGTERATVGEIEGGSPHPDVLALLAMSDEELMESFGHWYIPRRRPEYLRRNALVVLGNIGDPSDPATESILIECLNHETAVVRAHAVWAVRRLGLDHLFPRCAMDPTAELDPEVRAEFESEVRPRIGQDGRP